jgi:hypothetical protein
MTFLRTARLSLEPFVLADADNLFRIRGDALTADRENSLRQRPIVELVAPTRIRGGCDPRSRDPAGSEQTLPLLRAQKA